MKPDGCPHSDCARCNGTVDKLKAEVAGYELQVNSMVMSHREQLAKLEAENKALREEAVKALNRSGLGHMCELQDLWDILEPPKEGSSDEC